MSKPKTITSILILAALFAMGAPDDSAAAPYDSAGLQYQIVKFEKNSGAPGSFFCGTTFQAEFPEFVGAALPDALDAINAFVRYYLPVSSGRQPGFTLDEMADRMMSMWRRMRTMEPRASLGMNETFTVSVVYNRNGLLCLKFYWWSSGGAHPIEATNYFNFEMVAGSRLNLGDFLANGYEPKLDSLGEIEFRLERHLGADLSLEAAGYRFKDGRFAFNDNFAIDSTGLLFHFNDYEIAPHTIGAQEVTLSFDALADLIPRGGRLEQVAKERK